jgi:hypothetical protein
MADLKIGHSIEIGLAARTPEADRPYKELRTARRNDHGYSDDCD